MKVYITKHALTQGVFEIEAYRSDVHPEMAVADNVFFHSRDWHITKESALLQAETMRRRKVESLRKQLAKLEALKFS